MRAAKWILIIVGTLSTLLWLARLEENWRGQRDWQNCQREVEAKGISLTWNDYIPSPVPDDKNFFKAPKMDEWFKDQPYVAGQPEQNELSGLRTNTETTESITNITEAASYLAWSDQFSPQFDLIREALKRPYARMDGNYFPPFSQPEPNFAAFRHVSIVLAARAKSYLQLNQPEKALEELTFLNDFRHILYLPPTGKPMVLVTAMINVAIANVYASTIADGFKSKAWQKQQLEPLREQLRQIDLLPLLVSATHTENAANCYFVETNMIAKSTEAKSRMLTGWLLENLVAITKFDQEAANDVDLSNNIVYPQKLDASEREAAVFTKHSAWPDRILAVIAIPNFTKAWQTAARYQTLINEAQIACALERYRLDHGEYPQSLDALVPQYIQTIPHDLIGGQPLHYHRTSDGKFLLYSIGWNEKDDGGQESPSVKSGGIDYAKGDWVWPN